VKNNIVERNSRANIAVLDDSHPTVSDNLIQDGDGRGIVITGSASGTFYRNFVSSHVLAGMYVGGRATPIVKNSVVTKSSASGLVIEDMAQGLFVGNTFSNNGCAAIAIQGSSKPEVTGNTVMHSGRGGVWMGEYAQGSVRDNFIEAGDKAWRVGKNVRADVDTTVTPGAELAERIETDTSSSTCSLLPRGGASFARKDALVVVLIRNPDDASDNALSLGFSRCSSHPSSALHASARLFGKGEVRDASSPTNSDSVEEGFQRAPSINEDSIPEVPPPSAQLRIG
ncbi:pectin lyase fold/virulence factor, partial [Baffinella frigidus]